MEENVALPAVIAGLPQSKYKARVNELLAAVGLTDIARQLPSQISGGEQQRAAVARALVLQPTVVLADEPTGNLDSRYRAQILELLHKFHREGQTIVLVTHDPKVAGLGDRVIFMRDGRLIREERMEGSTDRASVPSKFLDLDRPEDTGLLLG